MMKEGDCYDLMTTFFFRNLYSRFLVCFYFGMALHCIALGREELDVLGSFVE